MSTVTLTASRVHSLLRPARFSIPRRNSAAKGCGSAARFSPRQTWERGTRQTAGRSHDLVEERERGLNLDVMRGASAAFGLLVENSPPLSRWQGFARLAFGSCEDSLLERVTAGRRRTKTNFRRIPLPPTCAPGLNSFPIWLQFNPATGAHGPLRAPQERKGVAKGRFRPLRKPQDSISRLFTANSEP